ncbi:CopG family ribbon-helix-helix protein [Lentzea guizhouensis]|uniref:CopG family ribbon-helix-helix protein n=1 Tax=Lentzea guizhouensis TaxID=1586287 RepID=UPI0008FF5FD0|nr:CopG family transcriptional regulator [Lentzea guizhouensis]
MTDKKPTSGGVELTDELMDRLAEEAEKGYDLDKIRPRTRRGRPPLGAEAATPFQVRLDPDLRDALQREANRLNVSPSEVVRTALREHIDRSVNAEAPAEQRRGSSSAEVRSINRRLLVVVRNHSSLDRLLELLPYLTSARGVTVKSTVDASGRPPANLTDRLERAGTQFVSWQDAVETPFDAVIAAHSSRRLVAFKHRNLFVVPHGVGFNRARFASSGVGVPADGFSAADLTDRHGAVFPAVIGLANVEQMSSLAEVVPAAVSKAVVIGDASFDRLQANSAHRAEFRSGLGVMPEERLVVVSSTWGEHSLLERYPTLVARLLSQLPVDQYKVVLVVHPNFWTDQKPEEHLVAWQPAVGSGLLVMPPQEGWRAALLAADVVIGDHGSVTRYAAALGKPLLEIGIDDTEAALSSQLSEFVAHAPKVDVGGDLRRQIETAVADQDNSWFEPIGRRMFVIPGESMRVLLGQIYGLMGLPEPKRHPRPLSIPPSSALRGSPPKSTLVSTTLLPRNRRSADALVERFPAGLAEFSRPQPDRVLVSQWGETDPSMLSDAHVHVRDDVLEVEEAQLWMASVLNTYPRASLAVAAVEETSCLLCTQDRRTLRAELSRPELGASARVAAAIHRLLVDGWSLSPGGYDLHLQSRGEELVVTVEEVVCADVTC